jgi:hypothetical protein
MMRAEIGLGNERKPPVPHGLRWSSYFTDGDSPFYD